MMTSCLRVLNALRKAKMKGITFDNFAKGCAMRSRISDLRKMGYEILAEFEEIADGVRRKRYWLIREPQ